MIRRMVMAVFAAATLLPVAAEDVLPYRNPALTAEERAADLCSRLTLDEKVKLMMNSSPAIDRLGIPAWDWWSEALHGVGRNGVATVFPSCIGMAASFDDDLIGQVFTAVSDEARAKATKARHDGTVGKYSCLSFWTPNINVFRDPRWGRGQETYGEDPYMNGRMGSVVVEALQGPEGPDHPYRKLYACAKHYAVHSGPEKTRHNFDIDRLPARELWETYLPAFKTLVQDAGVKEVMCAYQRFEGEPCCGSDRLLQSILRDEWGFDGMVVSDCGAIGDFWRKGRHGVSADAADASAKAVLSGTDVECGSNYRALPKALSSGLITEQQIDVSVRRLLRARFELGDMDPDSLVEWTRIPHDVVACDAHRNLALQMARRQMVLLKNDGVLPLPKTGKRIMVMGPNAADSTMMWGIYYGQPTHTVTALEGIGNALGGNVPYQQGCGFTDMSETTGLMDLFTSAGGTRGVYAEYWNNNDMAGTPVAVNSYAHAVNKDGGGNTAFEPGVNLAGFTVRMRGRLVAPRTERIEFSLYNNDGVMLVVNSDTLLNRLTRTDPLEYRTITMDVEQGRSYDVELLYRHGQGDAVLNFDVAARRPVTTDEVLARAEGMDVIIFVGGITPALEREEARTNAPGFDNGDRTSIELPQVQRRLLRALHDAGHKVVLVNCSGSAVALSPEQYSCDAILQAWYAGEQGGNAIADVLFGDFNPQGKLPVTFYKDDSQLPPFDEYRMRGRTYRFMRDDRPLYTFGHGLSYTTYSYGEPRYADGRVSVDVTNTGKCAGVETVLVFVSRPGDADGPVRTLRGYSQVSLQPGATSTVTVELPREAFEWWDAASGRMCVLPGEYEVSVGPSADEKALCTFRVQL